MKTTLRNELWLVAIVAIPFIYLIMIWNALPENVPVHWNLEGEIDRYGSRTTLLMIPILLPLLTYLTFLFAPLMDKKGQLGKMGANYNRLKFSVVLFTAVLASYILFAAREQTILLPSMIPGLIGLLFAVLGNYFPVLKQNIYIGIKTPWTLKSELVWDKTHRLAGRYWFFGGLSIVISSLFLDHSMTVTVLLVVTTVIAIVPIIYSYICYKKTVNKVM
jgi:uncharacterized membrane protein